MTMLQRITWMFFCAPVLVVYCATAGISANATPSVFHLKDMPDYCQLDRRLPNGGTQYCAPTAISNILVWLDCNGYPNLIPASKSTDQAQCNLIRTLGSELYMNTDEDTGTSPLDTMTGLERYVRQQGYAIDIEWKGWRDGGRFGSRNPIPTLDWLNQGTHGNSNIIISVGWYKRTGKKNSLKRLGGHYVTVVGIDAKNPKRPGLYIHNPSFGKGQSSRPEVCRLVPLASGQFEPWCGYKGHSTRGYFQIKDIPMRSDAQLAVLDGGIRFTVSLKKPETKLASAATEKPLPDKGF